MRLYKQNLHILSYFNMAAIRHYCCARCVRSRVVLNILQRVLDELQGWLWALTLKRSYSLSQVPKSGRRVWLKSGVYYDVRLILFGLVAMIWTCWTYQSKVEWGQTNGQKCPLSIWTINYGLNVFFLITLNTHHHCVSWSDLKVAHL